MDNNELFERYLLNRILLWQDVLEEMTAEVTLSVMETIESVQREVNEQLRQDALGLVQLEDLQQEQFVAFNAWADEVTAGARASITGTISEASISAATASLAAYSAILTLDGRSGFAKSVGMSTAQIQSWFSTTLLGTGSLADWIDQAFSKPMQEHLLTALRQSGLLGEGTEKAVERLLVAVSDNGFSLTRRDAISIARTYIQTANIRAQEAVYDANRSLLKGYKRVETLDNKTCALCALADGSEYGLDEKRPRLPAHPRCRGTWVPLAKSWQDFGFTVDDLEEVARPWTIREPGEIGAGGLKIKNYGKTTENFSGWWQSLSPADRAKTAINGTRQQLLESGQVRWNDLWDKATGRIRTLKELGVNKRG